MQAQINEAPEAQFKLRQEACSLGLSPTGTSEKLSVKRRLATLRVATAGSVMELVTVAAQKPQKPHARCAALKPL